MMRVALVCPYAWDRFGGVQSHIRALARTLASRGHTTRVLAPTLHDDPLPEPGVTYVGRAVRVPANGSVAPLAFGPLAAADVRDALEDFDPELVHLHEPLIPSLSLLALGALETSAVGTFHAAAESSLGYRASKAVLLKAAGRLTVKTAVSEAARSLAVRYFPGHYTLTPNGIETRRYAEAEPMDIGGGKKVLFLGRLETRKGLEVLIEAMAGIAELNATLVVAGRGPERRSCRALADRLGVRTTWLGGVSEADKPRLYRSVDAYCAPALGGESFGIVLIEAMAAGAPVVCSNLDAFRAVTDHAAAMVPPGRPAPLAETLREVLTDQERADWMRKASRLAAARFDWDRLADGVEAVYERALDAGRPGRRPGGGRSFDPRARLARRGGSKTR